MFRSYKDLIRTPKEADKPRLTQVYNCDMCIKGGWLSENEVEIHKKDSHFVVMHEYKAKHKDRFCTICMTLQESNEDLISHIKTQHLLSSPNAQRVERKIYICDDCTHIFFNKELLAAHILYLHLTNKYDRKNKQFTCPKCLKNFRLKSIWFHFQKHEIPSVTLCDICLTNFSNRAELFQHIQTHSGYFKCEPCGYNSTKDHLFDLHMKKHAQRAIHHTEMSSGVMNFVFKKQKPNIVRYNVHNAVKGLNLPNFIHICTLCREICLSVAETKLHILRDHTFDESKKKTHECVCGEEFDYKIVLKQHVMKMKGFHQPVGKLTANEVWHGDMSAAKTKILTPRRKLKSLLNAGEVITDKIIETDLIINQDKQALNQLEMELSNRIEVAITSEFLDSSQYTAVKDDTKIAMAVSVANALKNESTS